jgi:hypothetical protein
VEAAALVPGKPQQWPGDRRRYREHKHGVAARARRDRSNYRQFVRVRRRGIEPRRNTPAPPEFFRLPSARNLVITAIVLSGCVPGARTTMPAGLRILFATLFVACRAQAATITLYPPDSQLPAMVMVVGDLEQGDEDTFRFRTSGLSKAIVAFASDGGSLIAGIRIGEIVRLKGFVAVVPEGARCASACATAWLGGAHR